MAHTHEHSHEHIHEHEDEAKNAQRGAHKHPDGHGHIHGHAREGGNIRVAFFLNLGFTIVELAGGLLTNSIAIISDAIHDFGDSLSLGLAWYFQRLSKKGSTGHYTYGYKRFSLLGAIINSVVLVVGSIYVLTRAIPRLWQPQEANATGMLVLAVVGIVINGIAVLRTHKARSINERVVSLHLLEDVLGWAAVLVGSIVMFLTGWRIIDPILSIAIALFVLINVFRNIREVLPILLQGTPADISRDDIIAKLNEIDQVDDVHDLHLWSLDEAYNVLTAHIALAGVLPQDAQASLKCKIRQVLSDAGIQHATLELEAPGEVCGFTCS